MNYAADIMRVVSTSHNHPTAQEIYAMLLSEGSSISQATVYNNLKTLSENGSLQIIAFDGMPNRYDVSVKHDHLVCPRCGALTDVRTSDVTDALESQLGVSIEGYDLRIFVLCEACRAFEQ